MYSISFHVDSRGHLIAVQEYNYWALVLLIFPIMTLFGNVLVILSVYRERTLQTVTNYFIVSLAIADLLVAIIAMPFAVYVLVSRMNFVMFFYSLYFSADCGLRESFCWMNWIHFAQESAHFLLQTNIITSVDRFISIFPPSEVQLVQYFQNQKWIRFRMNTYHLRI